MMCDYIVCCLSVCKWLAWLLLAFHWHWGPAQSFFYKRLQCVGLGQLPVVSTCIQDVVAWYSPVLFVCYLSIKHIESAFKAVRDAES